VNKLILQNSTLLPVDTFNVFDADLFLLTLVCACEDEDNNFEVLAVDTEVHDRPEERGSNRTM